jgi:hypothetical protein
MFKLNKEIGGTTFNVDFIDKINMIKGNSGTGKTYLFTVLYSYCSVNNISCVYIDYKMVASSNESLIFEQCKNKKLILLDNADLYLTSELFNKIKSLDATIIISKKTSFGLNMTGVHLYKLLYENGKIQTRRFGK